MAGGHPWIRYALFSRARTAALSRCREGLGAGAGRSASSPSTNLADAYMLQHDDGGAEVLKDATRRWPRDAEAWNAIGVLHIQRKALTRPSTPSHTPRPSRPARARTSISRAPTRYAPRPSSATTSPRRWVGGESDLKKPPPDTGIHPIGGPYVSRRRRRGARLKYDGWRTTGHLGRPCFEPRPGAEWCVRPSPRPSSDRIFCVGHVRGVGVRRDELWAAALPGLAGDRLPRPRQVAVRLRRKSPRPCRIGTA